MIYNANTCKCAQTVTLHPRVSNPNVCCREAPSLSNTPYQDLEVSMKHHAEIAAAEHRWHKRRGRLQLAMILGGGVKPFNQSSSCANSFQFVI